MTTTDTRPDADLKARHRAMWGSGDYPTLAAHLIGPLGTALVDAAGVGPGQRVLGVAAGAGNAAIPAALAGADVVASDLTPELMAAGREAAASRGAALRWEEGDAEALPYDDDSFDVVLSCVGVMFAPRHEDAAGELVRVARPGGTLGLLSWTPEGFIGQMFAVMKPFAPPPPPGSQPPPLWGDEQHVRDLLGDQVADVSAERRRLPVDAFADGAEFRDYFKARYGPTIAVYRTLDEARAAELDAALAELGDSPDAGAWEYLLLTATVR